MTTKSNNSPVIPIKFPKISKQYVEIDKLFTTRVSYTTISIDASQWNIKLNLCTSKVKTCIIGLIYTINNTEIIFNIPKDFLQQMIPNEFSVDAIMSLPIDLKSAVISKSMYPIINTLNSVIGTSIIFNKISQPEKMASCENISINISSDNFQTNLYTSLSTNVIELLKKLPKKAEKNNLNIPYFIGVEAGSSRLTKLEINELELEDIIFIQQSPKKNQCFIRINKYVLFVGEILNNKLTIKSRVKPMDENSHIDDFSEAASDEQTEINENDIELNVVFEVGQQQINISELSKISIGHVFDLNLPTDNPVKVIVNGKYIADSELVEIDNRLGVRITKLH
jgi:type III secretion protein Q